MPKSRSSAEERILNFFHESSLEVAQVVLNLAKSAVKARLEESETFVVPAKKARKRRKQQKPAAAAEPAAPPTE